MAHSVIDAIRFALPDTIEDDTMTDNATPPPPPDSSDDDDDHELEVTKTPDYEKAKKLYVFNTQEEKKKIIDRKKLTSELYINAPQKVCVFFCFCASLFFFPHRACSFFFLQAKDLWGYDFLVRSRDSISLEQIDKAEKDFAKNISALKTIILYEERLRDLVGEEYEKTVEATMSDFGNCPFKYKAYLLILVKRAQRSDTTNVNKEIVSVISTISLKNVDKELDGLIAKHETAKKKKKSKKVEKKKISTRILSPRKVSKFVVTDFVVKD